MKERPGNSRKFIQYSGMAIEMGVLIFIGVWLGRWMDRYFAMEKPVFLVIMTLFFTTASIFRVIRSLTSP